MCTGTVLAWAPGSTHSASDAGLGTRFTKSQNAKRVSFNMSAQSEAVHVDGDKDKNMDETLEETELQRTVLTLESILLHLTISFFVLSSVSNQT